MSNAHAPRAVILLSGGLDSLTCLMIAKHDGFVPHAISFDYGQRHRSELIGAQKICAHYGVSHKIIEIQALGKLGGSALTDQSIEVKDHSTQTGIPNTYVPGRNTLFLSIALGYAEVIEAQAIYIGVSSVDYSGYPDCRPEYIRAFQAMANLATKAGIEGRGPKLVTPLQHLTKAETVLLGSRLGADYSLSVSCYRADEKGQACGKCDSCHLRQKGFMEAGLADPTRYAV